MDTKAEPTINNEALINDVRAIQEKLAHLLQQPHANEALRTEHRIGQLILIDIQNFLAVYSQANVDYWIEYSSLIIKRFDLMCYRLENPSFTGSAVKELKAIVKDLKQKLASLQPIPDLYQVTGPQLHTEQSHYHEQCQLEQSEQFHKILKDIETVAMSGFEQIPGRRNPKTFFISYACPEGNGHNEAYTNGFVHTLAKHVKLAGLSCTYREKNTSLSRLVLEPNHTNIHGTDFVIVICNRSLRYRIESGDITDVGLEHSEILEQWKQRGGGRFVVPLCLNENSFIPGLFKLAAAISVYKDGYLAVLKEIIRRGYGFNQEEFAHLWSKLDANKLPIFSILPPPTVLPPAQFSPPEIITPPLLPVSKLTSDVSALQQKLKKFYMTTCYSIQRVIPKLPRLPIEQCFIRLAMIEKHMQREVEQKNIDKINSAADRTAIYASYEDIFAHKEKRLISPEALFQNSNKKSIFRILIIGRAGIGKSATDLHGNYYWAKEKLWSQFKLVFDIKARNLKKAIYQQGATLAHMIREECFDKTTEVPSLEEIHVLLRAFPKKQILIKIDGLDELDPASPCAEAIQQLLLRPASQESDHYAIIVYTRPFTNINASDFDVVVECMGFLTKDISRYIALPELWPNEKTQEDKLKRQSEIILFLNRNPAIYTLMHVPLLLDMLCAIWDNNLKQKELLTITQFYQELLMRVWQRFDQKQAEQYLAHIISLVEIEETKKILKNKKVKTELFLEKLAYACMYTHTVMIDKTTIANAVKEFFHCRSEEVDEYITEILRTGILYTPDEQNFYFLHLTFQEYMSACYWVKLFTSTQEVEKIEAEKFLREHKFNPRYEFMWWFVSGLLKENRQALEDYFRLLEDEPEDLVQITQLSLLIRCLEECKLQISSIRKDRILEKLCQWVKLALMKTMYLSALTETLNLSPMVFAEEKVYQQILTCLHDCEDGRRRITIWNLYDLRLLPETIQLQLAPYLDDAKDNVNEEEVEAAIYVLARQFTLPDSILKQLTTNMQHWRSGALRCAAAIALRENTALPEVILSQLVDHLQEKHSNLEFEVLEALGCQQILPDSILLRLIEYMQHSFFITPQLKKILCQQSIYSDTIKAKLLICLQSNDEDTSLIAAKILGKQNELPESILLQLSSCLQHRVFHVRIAAAIVLGKQKLLPRQISTQLYDRLRVNNEYQLKVTTESLNIANTFSSSVLQQLATFFQSARANIVAESFLSKQTRLAEAIQLQQVSYLREGDEDSQYAAQDILSGQKLLPDNVLLQLIDCLSSKDKMMARLSQVILGRQTALPESIQLQLIGHLQNNHEQLRTAILEVLNKQTEFTKAILMELVDWSYVSFISIAAWKFPNPLKPFLDKPSELYRAIVLKLIAYFQGDDVNIAGKNILDKFKSEIEARNLHNDTNRKNEEEHGSTENPLDEHVSLANETIPTGGKPSSTQYLLHAAISPTAPAALLEDYLIPVEIPSADEIFSHLLTRLQNDEHQELRNVISRVLYDVLDTPRPLPEKEATQAIQLINTYFQRENAKVAAIQLLGKQTELSEEKLLHLASCLQDRMWIVRATAAKVLSERTTLPDTVQLKIAEYLQYDQGPVRALAAKVLGNQTTLLETIQLRLVDLLLDRGQQEALKAIAKALGKQMSLPENLQEFLLAISRQKKNTRLSKTKLKEYEMQPALVKRFLSLLAHYPSDKGLRIRFAAIHILYQQTTLSESVMMRAELISGLQSENEESKKIAEKTLTRQSLLPKAILSQIEDLGLREVADKIISNHKMLSEHVQSQLVDWLQDDEVQKSAVMILSNQTILHETIQLQLVACLQNNDLRAAVAKVLAKQTMLSVATLLQLASYSQHEDLTVRVVAIETLGIQSALPEDVQICLTSAFKKSNDAQVRIAIATALGNQAELSEHTLLQLVTWLNEEKNINCMSALAKAVSKHLSLPESIQLQLFHYLQNESARSIAALALRKDKALSDATELELTTYLQFYINKIRETATLVAMKTIAKRVALPEVILLQLVDDLRDKHMSNKDEIVEVLCTQTLPNKVMLQLIIYLQEDDGNIRHAAANVLRKQTTLSEYLSQIIALTQNKNSAVRKTAVYVLSGLKILSEEHLSQLAAGLQDEDDEVKSTTARTLGEHKRLPGNVLMQLTHCLQNEDISTRFAACDTLSQQETLPDIILLDLATCLLGHPDKWVNVYAGRQLDDALKRQKSLPLSVLEKLAYVLITYPRSYNMIYDCMRNVPVIFLIKQIHASKSPDHASLLSLLFLKCAKEKISLYFKQHSLCIGNESLSLPFTEEEIKNWIAQFHHIFLEWTSDNKLITPKLVDVSSPPPTVALNEGKTATRRKRKGIPKQESHADIGEQQAEPQDEEIEILGQNPNRVKVSRLSAPTLSPSTSFHKPAATTQPERALTTQAGAGTTSKKSDEEIQPNSAAFFQLPGQKRNKSRQAKTEPKRFKAPTNPK